MSETAAVTPSPRRVRWVLGGAVVLLLVALGLRAVEFARHGAPGHQEVLVSQSLGCFERWSYARVR